MKRLAVLCVALLFAGVMDLQAQGVTIRAENGWNFTFTGNVNAFLVFEANDDEGDVANPFALVGNSGLSGSTVRTGLLPAFATFQAAGREGQTDLMVHFGFAPQIQTPGGHDNFGNGTQAGAQIDMRQLFLTAGGDWGQILAGREIGVYQRQNILTDMTLFGVGATGGNFGNPAGTTLGRIGFGYVYPNFVAQMTYSSPADRPGQITIGLFNPSTNGSFNEVPLPRVEAEFTYNIQDVMAWAGGLAQYQNVDFGPAIDDSSTVAWGVSGGFKYGAEMFSVVGSGYYGQGIGTTLMFNGGQSSNSVEELRTSYGFIGQATVTPQGSKATIGASFGQSTLENADDEADFKVHNRSATGGVYYQATPSLKVVGEGTYQWADDDSDATEDANSSIVGTVGLMLFF